MDESPPPADLVVAVAITGSHKSKYVVKWALERFIPKGMVYFKLLHVRPVISTVKNHMGKMVPTSQASEDEAMAFRREVEQQVILKLIPFQNMCAQRKVDVKIEQIESNDIATAIKEKILQHEICNLVIGVSSRYINPWGHPLSSKISERCPRFCTVYAVSEGKFFERPSASVTSRSSRDYSGETSFSSDPSSSNTFASQTDQGSTDQLSFLRSSSLPMQRFQALSAMNRVLFDKRRHSLVNVERHREHVNNPTTTTSSISTGSLENDLSWEASTSENSPDNQVNNDIQQEKLRVKIIHLQQLRAITLLDTVDASRKINELQKRRKEDEIILKQLNHKLEEDKILVIQEKDKYEAAKREANFVKECAEREASERKNAEMKASRRAKENKNLENALTGHYHQFRYFTWEEIISATSSFSEDRKIGVGACGTVYKSSFHHLTAAVKILNAKDAIRSKQFQKELEILSQIHHQHILTLLGACPENACLVYEFMENGNLEDRLCQKNNASPLLWFERYRIAWEVASALLFLHSSKPEAIIHRDLKPANILLGHNCVSKIGDLGLSTMLQNNTRSATCSTSLTYRDGSVVAGTICYIDPEYQRTGSVSPKCDVYAFGMVLLKLLTAKQEIGLADIIETALDNNRLNEVLDGTAGKWPYKDTKYLALLALKCIEFEGIKRPDLRNEILPFLEELKEHAEKFQDSVLNSVASPPDHFKCPILKDVMIDPCVAADGHTYDRKAIEAWLKEKNTSPVTNSPLPHKNLTPNYTLLSAIVDWKSRNC